MVNNDSELEALWRGYKRSFKVETGLALRRKDGLKHRANFSITERRRKKNRKVMQRRGESVPAYGNTPLAAAMLRTVQEDFLEGVEKLPNDPRIKAVYAFIRIRETGNFVMNLDARKQVPGLKRWSFPGGGIEAGENVATALHRELREETGLYTHHWVFNHIGTVPLLHSDTSDLAALFFLEISDQLAGRIRPRTREQVLVEPKPREFIQAIAAIPSLQAGEVILDNHRNFWQKFCDWETRVLLAS